MVELVLDSSLRHVLATTDGFRIVELRAVDIPVLQRLYEANPEYSLAVLGRPPKLGEASDDFYDRPPPEFAMGRKWMLGFVSDDNQLAGIAEIISNLFAESVWHIGYFMLATNRHGSGDAFRVYTALESWILRQNANWLRLGVVRGNVQAERFWARCGYAETRVRENYVLGNKTHVVRVMVKPLSGGALSDYLQLVPRDRPG
jgi:GNAT superfamily N-acetyltransferase